MGVRRGEVGTEQFDDRLATPAAMLAGIVGAPRTAVVGWRRRHRDWDMWESLQRLGDPGLLETICAPIES